MCAHDFFCSHSPRFRAMRKRPTSVGDGTPRAGVLSLEPVALRSLAARGGHLFTCGESDLVVEEVTAARPIESKRSNLARGPRYAV
jgi:hypothetical protein